MTKTDGIDLLGPIEGRFGEVLTPAALDVRGAPRAGARRDAPDAPPSPGGASGGVRRRRAAGLPARDPRDPRAGVDGRPRAQGSRASLGRAHGAGGAEDGHQRAELRRRRLHGGLRGRQHAGVAQHGPGPGQPGRCGRADDRAPESGRPRVSPERAYRDPARPPPRLASRRASLPRRRRPDVGQPLRLRPLRVPQRPPTARARQRAVLLPAEAREPPGSAALERRVRAGRGPARPAARRDPRDRPGRDDSGRLRDGRDPLGAAGALGGPQRRPVGLHVQPHQEVPDATGVRAAGRGRRSR